MLNLRIAQPDLILDISRLASLSGFELADGTLRIGVLMRQRDAELSAELGRACPLIPRALRHVGHPAIRYRGTIGGSLAHADPAAELPAVMMALGAEFVVSSMSGRRVIPASSFFISAFTTAIGEGELLTEVRIPPAPAGSGFAILETSRRHGDFAQAGVVVALRTKDGALADVCIVPFALDTPARRVPLTESALTGSPGDAEAVLHAVDTLRSEVTPTGDLHATAAYKHHALGVLLQRALVSAIDESKSTHDRGLA
jgi:CO/xanthine dehydrogenase FAD-binding subunit